MADKQGRPVDAAAERTRLVRAKGVPTCTACTRYHGSVGAELACLRAAVVRLRGELVAARHVADSFLRALAPGR